VYKQISFRRSRRFLYNLYIIFNESLDKIKLNVYDTYFVNVVVLGSLQSVAAFFIYVNMFLE